MMMDSDALGCLFAGIMECKDQVTPSQWWPWLEHGRSSSTAVHGSLNFIRDVKLELFDGKAKLDSKGYTRDDKLTLFF